MKATNKRIGTMTGAVGVGLALSLLASGVAAGQGDLPGHARYRLVAMAPRAGGGGQLAGEGAGVGQGEGAGQNAPAKDDLFAGTEVFEKNATGVQEITMDPDSLNMVDGPGSHRAHNMVLNVVRTYSYDKPGLYNMADVDAFRNKLNGGDWHCSVHMRDLKNGSSTDVCSKRRTDGMHESAIITVEPKSLTFIHTIRKAGGPGESEIGVFPMMGMPGLPAIAMLQPELLMNLQMLPGLNGLNLMLGDSFHGLMVMPRIDSEEMARRMADAKKKMKDFNSPEMQKQMKAFRFEFKDSENSPENRQKMDELHKKLDDLKKDQKPEQPE